MADDWYIPENVTSVGGKEYYVAGDGIHIKRQCGDNMKDEIFLPKDIIIEMWRKFLADDELVKAWRSNIPCKNKG